MSRMLSMIVAAGCIVLAPAFAAHANPSPRQTHRPVTLKTDQATQIDISHLPPETQRLLRDFFARQAQHQATSRTTRQPARSPQTRTVVRHNRGSSPQVDLNFDHLPPDAQKMLREFFADKRRPGRIETPQRTARFDRFRPTQDSVARPSLFEQSQSARQAHVRTQRPTAEGPILSGNRLRQSGSIVSPRIRTTAHPSHNGSLEWAHDPHLSYEVIRAIGRHMLYEIEQERRQEERKQRGRLSTGVISPAS